MVKKLFSIITVVVILFTAFLISMPYLFNRLSGENKQNIQSDYSTQILDVLDGVPLEGTEVENNLTYTNSDNFLLVDDGKSDFTQDEIDEAANSYENYSPLDKLGRTRTAMASLSLDTLPKGQRTDISSIHPSGWVQKKYSFIEQGYLYNRSHLIAFKLSAENANPENLMTGTYWFNHTGMSSFEDLALDSIYTTRGHVLYRVTPIYQGENLLASGVRMEAYSVEDNGASVDYDVFIPNKQNYVIIDYKTGDSYSDYKPEEK